MNMLPVDDGAGLLRHIDALCALARYFKSLSSAGEYRFLPLDYKINSLLLLLLFVVVGVPLGFALGNSFRRRGIFDRISLLSSQTLEGRYLFHYKRNEYILYLPPIID